VIGPHDVRVAGISLSGGIAYLSGSMRDQIVGRVATEPLWAGKLLGPNSISDAPPLPAGNVAMSLLLKPDHAAGGALRAGDHVAVIASAAPGRGDGQTTILFTDVAVLAVSKADAAEGGGVIVTLRLLLQDARALAAARAAGDINLVLRSGAPS
ncbi:MAG: RcpC/CpaB family pilus assembly protein, partial [Actinomycetota bacterium]